MAADCAAGATRGRVKGAAEPARSRPAKSSSGCRAYGTCRPGSPRLQRIAQLLLARDPLEPPGARRSWKPPGGLPNPVHPSRRGATWIVHRELETVCFQTANLRLASSALGRSGSICSRIATAASGRRNRPAPKPAFMVDAIGQNQPLAKVRFGLERPHRSAWPCWAHKQQRNGRRASSRSARHRMGVNRSRGLRAAAGSLEWSGRALLQSVR